LHRITLENILNQLVQRHGWSETGRRIPIRCFQFNPSVKSSLTFLRQTPGAHKRVEDWFIGGQWNEVHAERVKTPPGGCHAGINALLPATISKTSKREL
jgi:uncharacterized protein (DUF2132 family)